MSMYETGSGLKPYLPKGETPYPEEGIPTLQPFPPHVSKTCSLLSFAISSPLPCFHDFPSCLHPVCKPFSLFILKQFFFLILEVFFFFFSASKTVTKKHNIMRSATASHISSCPDTYSEPLSCIYLLFTGVLLVCQTKRSCTLKEMLLF